MKPPAITLIGMPGAGKTTLGRKLAQGLAMEFVDTDQLLEAQEKSTLQQILDRVGPLALRAMEGELAANLPVTNRVIATGGSMVYSPAAMNYLHHNTLCVFLKLDLHYLERRLGNLKQRGFASPGLTLQEVLEERTPLYEKYAHLTLCLNDRSKKEALTILLEAIQKR